MNSPTAATRLVALLGDPVGHSLSPVFQNAAIRAAALDAVYVALRCTPGDLPGLLNAIARAGGAGNVTVPHKAAAAAAVERRTAVVDVTGACNCFWLEDGEVWGDNTDVEGAAAALRALIRRGASLDRVLLLGGGGAAAAALVALAEAGCREVRIATRDPERGRSLARRFATLGPSVEVGPADGRWDMAVNATPLGLKPGELPPLGDATFGAALDLVYAPGTTTWIRSIGAEVPALDGAAMLLHQGAAAFRRWFRTEPDLAVMRAVLGAAHGAETPDAQDR